jgi:hypothetical protein
MSLEESKEAGRDCYIENSVDPWGRPYIYKLVDGKPRAACIGRDGVPGGTGPDEDQEVTSDEANGQSATEAMQR